MAGFNNFGPNMNNGYDYGNSFGSRNNQNGSFGLSPNQIAQYFERGYLVYTDYVSGKTAAELYQLPPGVTKAILWDNDRDRYYVKTYDDTGRPRVVADNDFMKHIDPEPQPMQNIDLTPYATKEDIQKMISQSISEVLGNINIPQPNLSGYVTMQEFNQALGNLSVGNGGRIVRIDEPNA